MAELSARLELKECIRSPIPGVSQTNYILMNSFGCQKNRLCGGVIILSTRLGQGELSGTNVTGAIALATVR